MRVFALTLSLGLIVACGDDEADTAPGTTGSATDATSAATDETTSGDPSGDSSGDPTGSPANCGDGKVDPDEECDAGAANSDIGACTTACKNAKCGDGLLYETEEECDDANVDSSDICVPGCKLAECGDGFLGPGESCDDGNDMDNDDCSNSCGPVGCGNGTVDGSEDCDDGNKIDSDACLSSCQAAKCGDGFIQIDVEQCDDGNAVDDDFCSNSCTLGGMGPGCADGQKNGDETDIDCGGACSPCGDGKSCAGNEDCASGQCSGGVCEPKGGVTLEPVNCAPAMVGVDAAFKGAIMGNCGCHGGGSGGLMFNDAASFKAATVNVKATKAGMNRITPGKIDESYILYKLHGQQAKVPMGGGSQMPLGGMQLADDQLCLMINWVKSIK
jgi:cysteine-rich repeat protein